MDSLSAVKKSGSTSESLSIPPKLPNLQAIKSGSPSATDSSRSIDSTDSSSDNEAANGCCNNRFRNFLYNARTFFSHLWNHKAELGLGLLNITGGLVCIFLVDLPTFFGSETITNGLPFFMIGAGTTLIGSAFIKAAAETRNSNYASELGSDIENSQNGSGKDGNGNLTQDESVGGDDTAECPNTTNNPGLSPGQSPPNSKDKALV